MLLLTAGGALKANASRIAEGSCDVAVSLPRLLSARDIVANDGTLPQDTLITKSHIPDHIIFLSIITTMRTCRCFQIAVDQCCVLRTVVQCASLIYNNVYLCRGRGAPKKGQITCRSRVHRCRRHADLLTSRWRLHARTHVRTYARTHAHTHARTDAFPDALQICIANARCPLCCRL